MKNNCKYDHEIWDYVSLKMTDKNHENFKNHLEHCNECSLLVNQISSWKSDLVYDNPYLAEKILGKVTTNDIHYSGKSKFAVRMAFSIAVFIGISIGSLYNIIYGGQTQNVSTENSYQVKLDAFSSETYYNELKTEETQLLLTDLN